MCRVVVWRLELCCATLKRRISSILGSSLLGMDRDAALPQFLLWLLWLFASLNQP